VRVKPDQNQDGKATLQVEGQVIQLKDYKNKSNKEYKFDKVYDTDSKNNDIYNELKPSVPVLLKGMNMTVLGYGQTGTGKTHTISGSPSEAGVI
jgi:S-adenosylhomocysteine hydrolase